MDPNLKKHLERLETLIKEAKHQIENLRLTIWNSRDSERMAYKLDEAARLTGLSYNTLLSYIRHGKLSSIQLGGKGRKIIVRKEDLYQFIKEIRVDPLDPRLQEKESKRYSKRKPD